MTDMSETGSEAPFELLATGRRGIGRAPCFLLGILLPWPTGIAAVFIGDTIRSPCNQFFCGVGGALFDLTLGYFVGWLLSALVAWNLSQRDLRGQHFRATVKGAAVIPGLFTLLIILVAFLALLNG